MKSLEHNRYEFLNIFVLGSGSNLRPRTFVYEESKRLVVKLPDWFPNNTEYLLTLCKSRLSFIRDFLLISIESNYLFFPQVSFKADKESLPVFLFV
jgi:hypothetical protein